MTNKEANRLLDMARNGRDIPEEVITEALEWTDDIEAFNPYCDAVEAYVDKMRKSGLL
jgi:hypothetical protein